MAKLLLTSFICLLVITGRGVAGNNEHDKFNILEEFGSDEIDEENEEENSEIPSWNGEHRIKVLVNVDSFGAAGDGVSDDTQVCIFTYNLFLTFRAQIL